MSSHKAVAEALALVLADNAAPSPADAASMIAVAQAATLHALLALVEQVAEVRAELHTGNLIAAMGTDSEDGLIAIEDQAAAEIYLRERLGLDIKEGRNR